MTFSSKILESSKAFATNILKNEIPTKRYYHNYTHTAYVADKAERIGKQSNLSDDELENILVAAWFHDTGYREKSYGHEDVSKEIALAFLKKQNIPQPKIDAIMGCIEATRIPQSPKNKVEEVICDADLAHLAEQDFLIKCDPLRKEWEAEKGREMSDMEWLQINYDFMVEHSYFTAFGQAALEETKKKNLKQVKKLLKKLNKKQNERLESELGIPEERIKKLKKKLQKVENKPERGVETVFRITSRNHLELSSMADSKSNIMISVNTIIVSVIISALSLQPENVNPVLIFPAALLLLSCLITIIFSVLATRPNVTSGRFTREDVENRRTNLLFFGNFHKMKREDYEWGMWEMLDDSEYLYGSLIRDIYFLGKVLGKKYRMLRIAYNIFMMGLVISVLAFLVSIFIASGSSN